MFTLVYSKQLKKWDQFWVISNRPSFGNFIILNIKIDFEKLYKLKSNMGINTKRPLCINYAVLNFKIAFYPSLHHTFILMFSTIFLNLTNNPILDKIIPSILSLSFIALRASPLDSEGEWRALVKDESCQIAKLRGQHFFSHYFAKKKKILKCCFLEIKKKIWC